MLGSHRKCERNWRVIVRRATRLMCATRVKIWMDFIVHLLFQGSLYFSNTFYVLFSLPFSFPSHVLVPNTLLLFGKCCSIWNGVWYNVSMLLLSFAAQLNSHCLEVLVLSLERELFMNLEWPTRLTIENFEVQCSES